MRWVPELGLSVILLANVTYAKCELARAARARARRPRGRAAAPGDPARSRPAGGARGGRRPRRALGRRRRGPAVHAERRPRPAAGRAARRAGGAARAPRSARARRRHRGRGRAARAAGACAASAATSSSRSRWRRRSRRSCRRSRSSRSCRRPAGSASWRPRPHASRASRTPARSRLCSRPAPMPPRRCARCASPAALYGPFGEPEPVAGDGAATTTLRLPGPRGDVDLELELDEAGERLAKLALRPAAPRLGDALRSGRGSDRHAANLAMSTHECATHGVTCGAWDRASYGIRGLTRFMAHAAREARGRAGRTAGRLRTAAAAISHRPASNEPVPSRSAPSASGASAPMQ